MSYIGMFCSGFGFEKNGVKNVLNILYSPEFSAKTNEDAADAEEGAEGSELYQNQDGEHMSLFV